MRSKVVARVCRFCECVSLCLGLATADLTGMQNDADLQSSTGDSPVPPGDPPGGTQRAHPSPFTAASPQAAVSAGLVAQRDGPVARATQAIEPRTPLECRQETLKELRRLREQSQPEFPASADEHIDGGIQRKFGDLQRQAFLLLLSADDAQAREKAIQTYDLENPDDAAWLQQLTLATDRLQMLTELARALDAHRPALARRIRARLLLAKELERETKVLHPKPVRELSLEDLKREATQAGGWGARRHQAILQWAQVEPRESAPWLLKQIQPNAADINIQWAAARALAFNGETQGLAWLQEAALGNVGLGGAPGAALLDAGERGEQIYFRLIQEHEKLKPGTELPCGLGDAASDCSDTALFRNLDRLLQIKGERISTKVRLTLQWRELQAAPLSTVIRFLEKCGYDDIELSGAVQISLREKPLRDPEARRLAGLWVDQLLGSNDAKRWEIGANTFVAVRLGTAAVAAASARKRLARDSTRLACRILCEAGRTEDSLLIWRATHRPSSAKPANWYDAPSEGWEAILQLTDHLPE